MRVGEAVGTGGSRGRWFTGDSGGSRDWVHDGRWITGGS